MVHLDSSFLPALIDTGSSISVLSLSLCRRLKKVLLPPQGPVLKSAFNNISVPLASATARLYINSLCYPFEFRVLSDSSHDIILGLDFLKENYAVIDCVNDQLLLSDKPIYDVASSSPTPKLYVSTDTVIPPSSTLLVTLRADSSPLSEGILEPRRDALANKGLLATFCVVQVEDGNVVLPISNILAEPVVLPQGFVAALLSNIDCTEVIASLDSSSAHVPVEPVRLTKSDIESMISETLYDGDRGSLVRLILEFSTLFDADGAPLGVAADVQHTIDTGDARPLRQRPYRVSLSERETISTQVDTLLSKHIIQPSTSPWSSPVVLVRKKDGSIRFCVDYRRLNKVTKKDVYPMPRIDDALDSLRGARYFSSLDLRSGYWQVPMSESDKEKTAFVTPDGLFEFNVMPFGLSNAPATFERMMDTVLRRLRWKICLCYLDDVVVFSTSFSEHLNRLRTIFSCLLSAGLQLNRKKCHFAHETLRVLGHVVSADGVSPDPDKVKAVSEFPVPQTTRDLRSFVGLSSYFRRFIRGFATIAAPLTNLLGKDTPFKWTQGCANAFSELKRVLTSSPILRHYDPDTAVELHTDASGDGIGAVLAQRGEGEPMEHAVAYASRTLTKAERNYSTTEKECLAIVWAVVKFRPYLYGRPFIVVTDHHALCWLTSLKDPSGRLGRWALRLQEFDITVLYKSGRKHADADALSRCALPISDDAGVSPDEISALISYDTRSFAAEQLHDPQVFKLMRHLDNTLPSSDRKFVRKSRHFVLRDGVLYRKNYASDGNRYLLVIPKHLWKDVLQSLHDDPTAGHLGFFKTYERVRQRYFWVRLYTYVYKYVTSCPQCQRRKAPTSPPAGLLQPLPPPEHPFDRVGIDLFGPLPASPSKNRWVIVAIDHLTRYVVTAALPTGSSAEIANFFIQHILLIYGAPRVLISDRGRSFLARLLQDIFAACSVVHRFTSGYHPQTNGLTERFNHTLADMLSFYISAEHTNWDTLLPYLTFAYNTAVQSTTGYSPFRLMFGQEALSTLDTLFPYAPPSDNLTLAGATCRSEECRQLARLRTFDAQASSKLRYDEHHRQVTYSEGDMVWLWVPVRKPGLSEKLLCQYLGPYRVLRPLSPVTYLVEPVDLPSDRRCRSTESAHVSRLKPYVARVSTPTSAS